MPSNLDFLSCSITSDEDSPYFQCEVTMKDAKDYVKFPRDTPFEIHLFDIDYHFIVDSRSLNRGMDDEGNYAETCSFSGLSPLVRFASPRATPITKTWTVAMMASALVEELIGPVTWGLIDWMIPAYRLAAENAAPLDIAQQIVQAVGGLIESQPDGSVVCRHRWPTSIQHFAIASPDHILEERMIFSAQESPTNDELIDKVRILDYDAGYQDRLEYVPNKINDNEDDPFKGILYAYLSPWRDGLRIVTTRPSVIVLGGLSEGTRTITDVDEELTRETLTFAEGESSTRYPIMSLQSVEWLDENLGGLTFSLYSTTVQASLPGSYGGYSLAKIGYTTRFLKIPVRCIEEQEAIEAQFLLLENQND